LRSNLLIAVNEEWMNFGNKLSDIKEPALEDSASVVTPPLPITKHLLYHRDFCVLGLDPEVVAC